MIYLLACFLFQFSMFMHGGEVSATQNPLTTSRLYLAAQLAHTTYDYDTFNKVMEMQKHDEKHWIATLEYAVNVSNLPITRALLKHNVFTKSLKYYPYTFLLLAAAQAVQHERSSCCSFNYAPYVIFSDVLKYDKNYDHRKLVLAYGVGVANKDIVEALGDISMIPDDKKNLLTALSVASWYPTSATLWKDICCCCGWSYGWYDCFGCIRYEKEGAHHARRAIAKIIDEAPEREVMES